MDNNQLQQIYEILQKIKKKQNSLKANLNDIREFINASFENQNKEKIKAIFETEKRIKNNLDNNLKKVQNEISNQIEKDLSFKNLSNYDNNNLNDNNNNKEFELNETNAQDYIKTKTLDDSFEKKSSMSSEEETEFNKKEKERKEREEKERKERKEKEEKERKEKERKEKERKDIKLKFLSKDIEKKYKLSDLKELHNISFKITIKNIDNFNIDNVYIKFKPKDEIFQFKQKIDKLSISEEKSFTIKLNVNGEDIINKYKNGYETNIIFYHKEYYIHFEPIKFKFIVMDSDEDEIMEDSSPIYNKDMNSDHHSDKDESHDIHNNFNNRSSLMNQSTYYEYDRVELQGEELKKFRDELEIKYYISNIPKNDGDINRKINQYIEDYNKYINEDNNENKEILFNNLIDKIGDDLAFVETNISKY